MAFDTGFESAQFLETHIFQTDLTVLTADLVTRAEYEQRFAALVPLLGDIWIELPQNWLQTEDGDSRFLQSEFFSVLNRVNQPHFWDAV